MNSDLALGILRQLPTPVMAVNKKLELTYVNDAGLKMLGKSHDEIKGRACSEIFASEHCTTSKCRMKSVMAGGEATTSRNRLTIDGRDIPIEYTAAALKDPAGDIVGGVEYLIDITERERQEKKLAEQSRTIMEISTPAIRLWDRILILPVVGVVDSLRAQQMMNTMLKKIMDTSAKVIILDIQGVAAVDTAVANHLIKIAKATKLMGCRCIISGISPAVAETIVQLGIELGDVATNSTLKDALADAFELMDFTVIQKDLSHD
ncbi:MAG: PAS domain-containing protein [Desulfobacter sp.]|nr:MAG: PAS domain-containing protein [Desulfobacter sp.]